VYFLARVDVETEFNESLHATFDEDGTGHLDFDVFDFSLEHGEGQFASLSLVIRNPRAGLLEDGKHWVWFSELTDSGVVRRFYGRIVGLPEDLQQELLTITYVGRPVDFVEQQEALADGMKGDPQYWEPILINKENLNDPDAVLIARTAAWHIDPVTHVVTVSDKVTGEAGLIELDETDVFYDPSNMSYGTPPARNCEVTAEIRWTQRAAGEIDIEQKIRDSFSDAGSPNAFMAATYNPAGLLGDWPSPGTNIGRGWKVKDADAVDVTSTVMSAADAEQNRVTAFASQYGGSPYLGATSSVAIDFNLALIKPTMIVEYDVARSYTEIVTFTMEAGVQSVVTDPGDQEVIRLSFSSNDVSEPVDPADTDYDGIPIVDVRRRSYMLTERGHNTMKFLVARARKELIERARCVDIPFECAYARIDDISLRKSASLSDPRLPGGVAQGKIVYWRATGNGDSGEFTLAVTISCCVGTGGSASAALGSQTWVEDGWVEDGWQTRENASILVAGDVTFTDYGHITPNDDGLDLLALTANTAIEFAIVTNGPTAQANAIGQFYPDVSSAGNALAAASTTVCLDFIPLTGGPFETEFPITVSDLVIPNGIDLAAA
jgi:hypothetical protein